MAGCVGPRGKPETRRGGSVGDEQYTPVYWGRLVAHLAIDTGRPREEVLDFDADYIDDLLDAWTECPPARWLMAAQLGYKPHQVEPVDLPDGSFEAENKRVADLFVDPQRFFKGMT